MKLQIDWSPERFQMVADAAREAGERAENLLPPMRKITELYLVEQARIFDSAGDDGFGSGGWAPLTEATKVEKDRRGFGSQPIGVERDSLRASVTRRQGSAKGALTRAGKSMAVMGTKQPHAHLFAKGTDERVNRKGQSRGRMPARPMAIPARGLQNRFFTILLDYLIEGVVTGGLPGEAASAVGLGGGVGLGDTVSL